MHPIHIAEQSLNQPELFDPYIQNRRLVIVSDKTVAALYLPKLNTSLRNHPYHTFLIPEGEKDKTLETWQSIQEELFAHGYGRDTLLIALGGGIVSDIAGFAAATYQRGIPWMVIPTTLLAQVDAAIGGKTGVNNRYGKNMIGAFHQPEAVIIDPCVLDTLPERDFSAGLAEIIKYGLIYDADFFSWLEINMLSCAARVPAVLAQAIQRACEIKATIVSSDEKDTANKRAILNFGHTFGHAMETVSTYDTLLHGEAVAIGMVMAATLSVQICGLPKTTLERIKNILKQAGLPTERPSQLSPERIANVILLDKKNQKNTHSICLILLKRIGEAEIVNTAPMDQIKTIIRNS